MIGPPIEYIMRLLLEPYGDGRVAEAVADYRDDYGRNGLFGSVAYPGIAQALGEIRRSGARLYLATSKRTRFALPILEHLSLADFFDGIHGSKDGGALDHKPELIADVVERHAMTQGSRVMVGDRRQDVPGARANGMRALGVLWGCGTCDELEAAGADELVTGPGVLPPAALATAWDGMIGGRRGVHPGAGR